MSNIRVRFAPSPTGNLHLGSLRTTLFNFLYARHVGGAYVVRIEDTDAERSRAEYTESILGALDWCNIASDEPIVIQSERAPEHRQLAQQLLEAGKAYRCYCTQEDLQQPTENYRKYAGVCRSITEQLNKPFVIRFKLPEGRTEVSFNDLIHGPITFTTDTFDDFIIVRSDGAPMYNFVVVADDAFMHISHVIRGEEHLVNTPRQILLYEACGFKIPSFAHTPLILGPNGSKLSKRDAATAVLDYKKLGYLPDAFCNYLVRLGWAHKDQEVFSRAELVQFFTLEAIGKKGAIFDQKKLDWLNSVYLRNMTPEAITIYCARELNIHFAHDFPHWSLHQLHGFIQLYKERVNTLIELHRELSSIYTQPALTKFESPVCALLAQLIAQLQDSPFTHEDLELRIKLFCTENNIGLSAIAPAIRIALTGQKSAPGVYALLALLGKKESLTRLKKI